MLNKASHPRLEGRFESNVKQIGHRKLFNGDIHYTFKSSPSGWLYSAIQPSVPFPSANKVNKLKGNESLLASNWHDIPLFGDMDEKVPTYNSVHLYSTEEDITKELSLTNPFNPITPGFPNQLKKMFVTKFNIGFLPQTFQDPRKKAKLEFESMSEDEVRENLMKLREKYFHEAVEQEGVPKISKLDREGFFEDNTSIDDDVKSRMNSILSKKLKSNESQPYSGIGEPVKVIEISGANVEAGSVNPIKILGSVALSVTRRNQKSSLPVVEHVAIGVQVGSELSQALKNFSQIPKTILQEVMDLALISRVQDGSSGRDVYSEKSRENSISFLADEWQNPDVKEQFRKRKEYLEGSEETERMKERDFMSFVHAPLIN